MYQNQIIECFVDIASKFLMFVLMNLILMNTCLHITYILNIKVNEFILTIYYILVNYLSTTFVLIFIILIIYPKIIIGVGIIQGQFLRISTTAAAIWQQMM